MSRFNVNIVVKDVSLIYLYKSFRALTMPTVTEEDIATLVDEFYGKIRYEPVLGPIFNGAIGEDWGPHLAKMKAFWSSVFLGSGTYKGNPMMAHLQLPPRLTVAHFQRWLDLWRETAAEHCSQEVAYQFVERAEMIGQRLLQAITLYHPASIAERSEGMKETA